MISTTTIEEANALLRGIIQVTPYQKNINYSERYDANIYLKREDLQVVRSFKIRGAYNKIASLTENQRQAGIVCASAGNHAQGFAWACAAMGINGYIYMPTTTPNQKISKVRHFGNGKVQIILKGDTFDDANALAMQYAKESGMAFIHPFDDEKVIAGQGTIACEILEQSDVVLDYVFVAVGGGGLISGVGSYIKQKSPHTQIIAVEAQGAPALYRSLYSGDAISLDQIDTFADGIAVKKIGDQTFKICQEVVDDNILVAEGAICSSILSLYNDDAIVVEPAGAISFAALELYKDKIKGKNVAIIVCGGNNDIARTEEIRERALLYEGRKHYFIIRFPQRAGALRDFLNLLGPDDDIAHFEYTKKTNKDNGPALVGLELKSKADFETLIVRLNGAGINYEHINNNPMLFEMLV
jgi:threonine dehydratase